MPFRFVPKTLVLALLLGACSRLDKNQDDTLIIGIPAEVKNLDLRVTPDSYAAHISRLVMQTLINLDERGEAQPEVAESLEIRNGRVFDFKIRKGLSFHDGHPLSPVDVKYSFEQAAGPNSKIKASFADVEKFEITPDDHFVISLKAPRASFLLGDVLAIRIFPAHLAEAPDFSKHPVGSGPYAFAKRQNRDLIFRRFDLAKRYDRGVLQALPSFEKIIVRSVGDPTTRFLSLLGGDIDILQNALSPRRAFEAALDPRIAMHRGPGSYYQYIGLNLRHPKLRDRRVREALALALNRPELIEHKLRGLAHEAESVFPAGTFFFHPALAIRPHDLAKAKRLLKEANAENLELEIKSSADRDSISMLQAIQNQWLQAGIKTRLKSFEFATFFSDIQKGNFEVFSLQLGPVVEPDLLFKLFHSKETPPGRNRGFYENPELDKLLASGRQEFDPKKRQQIYFNAQEILARDMPLLSLWYPDNVALVSKRVKNFTLHPAASWISFLNARKEGP